MITIDEFKKLEIKIGKILSVEKVPETDKLLKLSVDFGVKSIEDGVEEKDIRQIVSGISSYFPEINILVGKKCAFATNLEPRSIKGLESNGMILAVSGEDFFSLLEVSENVLPGATVR